MYGKHSSAMVRMVDQASNLDLILGQVSEFIVNFSTHIPFHKFTLFALRLNVLSMHPSFNPPTSL